MSGEAAGTRGAEEDRQAPDGASLVAARYRSATFTAMYLLAEWGDRFEPRTHCGPIHAADDDSMQPAAFYRRCAELAVGWLDQAGVRPLSWCDVGGATGRFLREVMTRVPSLVEGTLVEPSDVLSGWARRLLMPEHSPLAPAAEAGRPVAPPAHRQPAGLVAVPLPGTVLAPQTVHVPLSRWPEPVDGISVLTADAEAVASTGATFDAISCLNVLDRVGNPGTLVDLLGRLVRHDGVLILACPFDFKDHYTTRAHWFADLAEVLDDQDWHVLASADLPYVFRQYDRRVNTYLSQVVAAIRVRPVPQP
jgi:SAM-dependent methyltransferase